MLIFDMHTHCFPDALAPKALPRLAEISRCAYHGDGTYGSLCEEAAAAGCAGFMILHIATKPSQMTSVNNFAAAAKRETPTASAASTLQLKTPWTSCTASRHSGSKA